MIFIKNLFLLSLIQACSGPLFSPQSQVEKKGCEGKSECGGEDGTADNIQEIMIFPAEIALPVGKKQIFSAAAKLKKGTLIDISKEAGWSMQDPSVASLEYDENQKPFSVAMKPGSTELSANYSGFTARAVIKVLDVELLELVLEPGVVTQTVGSNQSYLLFGQYSDGVKRNLSSSAEWQVDKSTLLRLADNSNKDGKVGTALASGMAQISAAILGKKASASIQIKDLAVASIVVSPSPVATEAGLSFNLKAQALYFDGTQAEVTSGGNWTSANTTLVTTDPSVKGQFKALKSGSTQVGFTFKGITVQTGVTISPAPLPVLSLKVNNVENTLTVLKGSNLTITWTSTNAVTCSLKENVLLVSEALNSSTNRTANGNNTYQLTCLNRTGAAVSKTVLVNIEHNISFAIDPGTYDFIPATSGVKPLSIYFLLDVTGSMAEQINTVKNNISIFVNNLVNAGFSPLLGLQPFDDAIRPAGSLTSNIAAFQALVNSQVASGGDDDAEGSLLAIQEGLRRINLEDTRVDSIKVLFLITDNLGHAGSLPSTERNCNITSTVNVFSALSGLQKSQVKFFYSVPDAIVPNACSSYTKPSDQFSAILANILNNAPLAERGGYLSFPFSAASLNTELVNKISVISQKIDLVCLAENARVTNSSQEIMSWTSSGRSQVFTEFNTNRDLRISRTISNSFFNLLPLSTTKLAVSRCCVSLQAAGNSNFSSCIKTHTNAQETLIYSEAN